MPALPKVELHLHLDCSLSYNVVHTLDPSITHADYNHNFIAPRRCNSLADFLTRAPRGFKLMQDERALELVTGDIFRQLARDHILYAEIRFAPLLHTERGLTPHQVVAAVDRATDRCIISTGIEARLILCTLRHYTAEQSLLTARLVHQFQGTRVVALDIAGDEAGYPLTPHLPAFRYAIEHNLHRTAHAGEALGAHSVWETLRDLRPTRIGHGVHSIEDPALVQHLRAQNIHLELCPSSNVQTRATDEYPQHPIDRLYRAGVPLNVNTDCRTITNITLEDEYALLRDHFRWTDADFTATNEAALKAAFIDDPIKQRLLPKLSPLSC